MMRCTMRGNSYSTSCQHRRCCMLWVSIVCITFILLVVWCTHTGDGNFDRDNGTAGRKHSAPTTNSEAASQQRKKSQRSHPNLNVSNEPTNQFCSQQDEQQRDQMFNSGSSKNMPNDDGMSKGQSITDWFTLMAALNKFRSIVRFSTNRTEWKWPARRWSYPRIVRYAKSYKSYVDL